MDDNGQAKCRVTYPKYKYGEATVREAKVPPNFGMLYFRPCAHGWIHPNFYGGREGVLSITMREKIKKDQFLRSVFGFLNLLKWGLPHLPPGSTQVILSSECIPNLISAFFIQEYVDDLFECLTTTHKNEFKAIRDELKNSTPEPRYNMMECEEKDAAIAKYQSRQQRQTVIVPPTCTGKEIHFFKVTFMTMFNLMLTTASLTEARYQNTTFGCLSGFILNIVDAELQRLTNPQNSNARKAPTCKTCGAPRKGHKKRVCATTQ